MGASEGRHVGADELAAGEPHVLGAPSAAGRVEMIVRRPSPGAREVVESAELVEGAGVVGDDYLVRGSRETADGGPHPEAQVTLMSARAVDLVSGGDRGRWALAGDQLLVELDLSRSNLPTGSRLAVGGAVVEVTAKPHRGCAKFRDRFGVYAARWVNSSDEHRHRGINAAVVHGGSVRVGDPVVPLR